MNKIYILLLITSTVSLTCMEKKLSTKKTSDLDIPLLSKNLPSQQSFEYSLLYNNSCTLIKNFTTSDLLTFVTDFNAAKNNGLCEDDMTKHAYQSKNIKLAMFFSYIKGYTQKKEALPVLNYLITTKTTKKINDPLAEYFEIESPDNTTITEKTYNQNAKYTHPAFHSLRYNVMERLERPSLIARYTDLFNYIYSDNTENSQIFPTTYDELKELFDNEAHKMFQGCKADIHMLLHIIELGKQLNPQKQESDFGRDIAAVPLTLSEQFCVAVWDQTKPVIDKQRIALLCKAIEKYNIKRSSKISPTHGQKEAYEMYFLDPIALPDEFDSKLLNKKIYAFDELDTLLWVTKLIKQYDAKKVENSFTTLYS